MALALRLHKGTPDVDIGVVYTYEDHFMPDLLSTLSQSGENLQLRLMLVDNASTRGSEPWAGYFPETEVLANTRRLGYASNLNRILAASEAPFVLLLNTDMFFDPQEQCIARMVSFMKSHPDCGVAGCRLYHADNSYAFPARRFQSLRTIAARRLGLAHVLNSEIRDYLYQDRDPRSSFECEWLSGCFLMVRRAAFEDVGYLDDGFAKYFEDVDFCLRMAIAGWKVMFHGGTYAYHLEQRSSRKLLSRDAMVHLRSYARWLHKWGFDPRKHIPVIEPAEDFRRAA